jgi:hypothetical protein
MTMASGVEKLRPSRGKRVYRGLLFGVMVGVVGAGLSIIPALFVQAIFIGDLQRCEDQQQFDLAATGAIVTTCGQDLSDQPVWLPPALIASGGLMGLLGGFGYGFISPALAPKRLEDQDKSWLPF